jgi:hypothetical protein
MFKAATKTLVQNQEALNEADEYNHNHGDNMVEIFRTISRAMNAKKTATPAEQLEYASKLVAKKSSSGSAQAYSAGLEQAAEQFQGRQINAENVIELVTTLMGAGAEPQQPPSSPAGGLLGSLLGGSAAPAEPSSPAEDLLGTLLGGGAAPAEPSSPAGGLLGSLLGGGTQQQQQTSTSGDMLGSLLGSLMGGSQQSPKPDEGGIDTGSLLKIGMLLFAAYKLSGRKSSSQGSGNLVSTLLDTLISNTAMGKTAHRAQSGKLVADSLLQVAARYAGSQ